MPYVQHKVYYLASYLFFLLSHTHRYTTHFHCTSWPSKPSALTVCGLFRRNKADIYCGLSLTVEAQICGAHKPHLSFLPVKRNATQLLLSAGSQETSIHIFFLHGQKTGVGRRTRSTYYACSSYLYTTTDNYTTHVGKYNN